MTGNIGPCVYPGCRDSDDNPRLTRDTVCDRCRHHYGRTLDRIALDYVALRKNLPARATLGVDVKRAAAREYGHPREWASDMCAKIADCLNWTEDALRDHRGDEPPPHPGHAEYRKVVHAHHYLSNHLDSLCTMPGAGDIASELLDVHKEARRGLGYTSPYWRLHTPCPDCELVTLVRHVDQAGGDQVECQNCRRVIENQHYKLYARIVLDDMLSGSV
jgi:hypothetical protein